MAAGTAIVCHSQESVNDSIAPAPVQQLSQEDINRAKELATRGIGPIQLCRYARERYRR